MAHSNNIDEILISYILNESNEEQELFVRNWLSKNDNNRLYFEQLVKTSGLVAAVGKIEDIDISNEWNVFKEARKAYENSSKRQHINEEIETELPPLKTSHRGIKHKMILGAAVAASILVMLSLGWKYFLSSKDAIDQITIVKTTDPVLKGISERHEVNNSSSPIRIELNDGSIITLFEKSEVRFSASFEVGKREIYLIGKAGFKVAKDRLRPFTVFSGDISTTALGTDFTVTAFKNAENITVRLYEGKVVIKSSKTATVRLKKNVYLNPGQELDYNNNNAVARITSFKRNKEIAHENKFTEHVALDNPNIPLNNAGSWFMFNNQGLSQIFDQLEGLYNVEIIYNKKDLQKMYFIGKFEKTDSLQNVLQLITSLNGLESKKKNNKYYISKRK